jgi:hypothetical protein
MIHRTASHHALEPAGHNVRTDFKGLRSPARIESAPEPPAETLCVSAGGWRTVVYDWK